MRVPEVILVGLPKGLGISRRHLPHIMTNGEKLPGHIVRSHARLYADQARRHIRKSGDNSVARHLLAQHNLASCIQAYEMEGILPWIDTKGDGCSV